MVGSLIGDLVRVASGDDDADCLLHDAVAFFTDAKVDLSGDDCSLDGVTAVLGSSISFRAVGLGLSVTGSAGFVDGVGKGREKRDWEGIGDDAWGDWMDCAAADFCGVLYDPETLLSGSSEAGFFGIPGEDEFRCETMDSGRGDFTGTSWVPDARLSSSNDDGFLGGSGVAFPNWPDEIRGDFAGVAGLPAMDCLIGVFVTGSSSDVPLVLEGTELGRTCSGFTNGTVVMGITFCVVVFSGSVAACLAAGALLLGPRALPLVICCSSGAGPVLASPWTALAGDSVPSALDVDLLVASGGGPRASIPASAGLKRSANLLAFAGSLEANKGPGCTGLSSIAVFMTRRLFFLARASGVACFGLSRGGGFEGLSARPRVPRLAIASGG